MSRYRQDHRDDKTFAENIKKFTKSEFQLMQLYVAWLNKKGKAIYTFAHKGVDNSGALIKDDKKVTSEADYVLYKDGKRPRNIDIKQSSKDNASFHLKINHIKRSIKEDTAVVNWMDVEGPNRRFCIITPKMLTEALESKDEVIFWSKKCLRWGVDEVKWIKV
jgi:hypothetical protein